MGLDCVPLGRVRLGHEEEWNRLLKELQKGTDDQAVIKRFEEISILAYAAIGAPIVGQDTEADAFVLSRKPEDSKQSDAEFLQQMQGYHVVDLLAGRCDGLPRYNNSMFGSDVDATSFRGAFLPACRNVIDKETVEQAWTTVMSPQQAVDYGNRLLQAAERAKSGKVIEYPQESHGLKKLLGRLSSAPHREAQEPLADQIEIVETAGRWYIFWGERGHPIWAYF
jgi:hypothetical protein